MSLDALCRPLSTALLVLGIGFGSATMCAAEPFSPAHVLRIPFVFNGNPWADSDPPVDLATLDTFEFNVGILQVESIESFTVSLFEGSHLLGSYTAPYTDLPIGRFRALTSPYMLGNPTVVDFTAFRNGTFDGRVEFRIEGGRGDVFPHSDDLAFGRALGPDLFQSYPDGRANASYLSGTAFEVDVAPVPEPASMLLFGTGVAVVSRRVWTRRRKGASQNG
jgi:hypothetical protein